MTERPKITVYKPKLRTLMTALLASLPIVSILSLIWLYAETKDAQKVNALSTGILWVILPLIVFFIVLSFF